MAFPKQPNTPRGRELRVKYEGVDNLNEWPQPTTHDHTMIGLVVVQFGYVDFNLQRLSELLDGAGLLDPKWLGKTAKLTMTDTAAAVQSSPVWTGTYAHVLPILRELEEQRSIRNLLAHCLVRRFPEDDALLFVFKSRRDYVAAYGEEPPAFSALMLGFDCDDIERSILRVEELQGTLAEVTAELEMKIEAVPLNPNV